MGFRVWRLSGLGCRGVEFMAFRFRVLDLEFISLGV